MMFWSPPSSFLVSSSPVPAELPDTCEFGSKIDERSKTNESVFERKRLTDWMMLEVRYVCLGARLLQSSSSFWHAEEGGTEVGE